MDRDRASARWHLILLVLALGWGLAAQSAWGLPTSPRQSEQGDFGSISLDRQQSTLIQNAMDPVVAGRPRVTLGLEATPEAFRDFYRNVTANYRHMEPLVLDLPEYTPGLNRPDLPRSPNDPRRQMMDGAIRNALGASLQRQGLLYLDGTFLGKTPLKALLPHLQQPSYDPTLPTNLVTSYRIIPPNSPAATGSLRPEPGPTVGTMEVLAPPHKSIFGPFRPIFGLHGLNGATIGVDAHAFSLQSSYVRGWGWQSVWAVVPLRGHGVEGNVGISNKGEVFLNTWIRF